MEAALALVVFLLTRRQIEDHHQADRFQSATEGLEQDRHPPQCGTAREGLHLHLLLRIGQVSPATIYGTAMDDHIAGMPTEAARVVLRHLHLLSGAAQVLPHLPQQIGLAGRLAS